jgi:hypothetical protein
MTAPVVCNACDWARRATHDAIPPNSLLPRESNSGDDEKQHQALQASVGGEAPPAGHLGRSGYCPADLHPQPKPHPKRMSRAAAGPASPRVVLRSGRRREGLPAPRTADELGSPAAAGHPCGAQPQGEKPQPRPVEMTSSPDPTLLEVSYCSGGNRRRSRLRFPQEFYPSPFVD